MEKASLDNLTPELKASMDELREAAESMKRSYSAHDPEKASDEANTIHNPVVKGSEEQRKDVTPATAEHQVSAPEHAPDPVAEELPASQSEIPAVKVKTAVAASIPPPVPRINSKMGVDDTQPLITHLIELRKRLINSILAILVIFLALVYFANDIYQLVSAPLIRQMPVGATMIATDVASPFFTPIS